ncbi:TonB-dependent receptor [Pelagicoccus mobilis]|uniref:TonB-dependent receptor n=1 Tax=Pelagicoccus mobilis TaxID=415221 RepID=A0A934RWF2_9BACT|nr:TonB-dependent receptor [Pelagicoccus mobilis]MBK1878995.1 TonB-dependent receptor [Pelagicoccus mobilis]
MMAQEGDEEVFELSPFTVSSTESSGYEVLDTLAGSRLRADVEDIGASITLVSKDVMDDLGISDFNELADYLPSSEMVTTQENENGGNEVFRGGSTGITIRGIKSEALARNYFTAPIGEFMPSMDGYNSSRVTLSAGANSILFGSASPAGIINTQTQVANLGKDSAKFRHRADDYGSQRFEFAVNRILLEDKLAIRVNLLNEEREFFRDTQWRDQERIYGAVTWKPFEKTTISANLEYGDSEANTATPTISVDRMGAWRDAGMPTVAWDGSNPGSNEGIVQATGGNQLRIAFGSNDPSVNRAQNWRRYAISDRYQVGSPARNASLDFDFMDHTQSMGNHRLNDRKFWIGDLSLEQKLSDNLYMQFAMFRQSHEKDIYWSGGTHMFADATSVLPDGSPNPNEGSFFFGGGTAERREFLYENENYRWTTTYELDLREKGEWLGTHQFSLMAQHNIGRRFTNRNRLYNTDTERFHPVATNGQNRIMTVFYVDPVGGDRARQNGESLDPRDWASDFSALEGVTAEYLNFTSGINTETKQNVYMAAGQSHFFNKRLVTTLGYRIDTSDVDDVAGSAWVKNADGTRVDFDDPSLVRTRNEAVSDIEEGTYSVGAVYHLLRDRGLLDSFSLSFNQSTNFQPSASDPNLQGRPLPFATGETKDVGIKASMFNGKLNGSLSWFEGGQLNNRTGAGQVLTRAREIWNGLIEEEVGSIADQEMFTDNLNELEGTVADTRDISVEGLEMRWTYSPNSNWRMIFFGSRNEAIQDNINPSANQYFAEHFDSAFASAYGDVPLNESGRTVDDAIEQMQRDLDLKKAEEGRAQQSQREWAFSYLTNYRFTEGALKGFSIGGNIKWKDKAAIGYASDEEGKVDISKPFYGEELLTTGMHFSYGRKIRDGKVDWKIQLNIQNLLDDDDYVGVRATESVDIPDTGEIYAWRIQEPRSFSLTNTFSF